MPPEIDVYPASYNRKALEGKKSGLKGDFSETGGPPYGTLDEIRGAFPEHVLRIHLGSKILISEPQAVTMVRRLPSKNVLAAAEKSGIESATRTLPMHETLALTRFSGTCRMPEDPPNTGLIASADFQIDRPVFLSFLKCLLADSLNRRDTARAAMAIGEDWDRYSGRHLSEWDVLFNAHAKVLAEWASRFSDMSDLEYKSFVYARAADKHLKLHKEPCSRIVEEVFDRWELLGWEPKRAFDWIVSLLAPHLAPDDPVMTTLSAGVTKRTWYVAEVIVKHVVDYGKIVELPRVLAEWSFLPGASEVIHKTLEDPKLWEFKAQLAVSELSRLHTAAEFNRAASELLQRVAQISVAGVPAIEREISRLTA